jgi:hypothetical protein
MEFREIEPGCVAAMETTGGSPAAYEILSETTLSIDPRCTDSFVN